jgi:hypothetical protein
MHADYGMGFLMMSCFYNPMDMIKAARTMFVELVVSALEA